jgi:uncharacterized phage protein (TIGR01671 family)
VREIKFKGKDIVGNWYTGNLAIVKQDIHNGAITIKAGSYISNKFGSPFAYQVRPETVGQFTGLNDKNGVEIYEGDLIKWFVNNKSSIGYVYFESGWFDLRDENGSICWDPIRGDSELIGNIHDQKDDV